MQAVHTLGTTQRGHQGPAVSIHLGDLPQHRLHAEFDEAHAAGNQGGLIPQSHTQPRVNTQHI